MRTLLLLPLLAVSASALAETQVPGSAPIRIERAWSRAAAQGQVGVLYLTVTDSGAPDRLSGVETPVAEKAEIHESMSDHGMMEMRPIATVDIAPGKPIVLKPGGYHVMLMGLRHSLNRGDSFPFTLHFANAGTVTGTAEIAKAGAARPDPDTSHTDHGTMRH